MTHCTTSRRTGRSAIDFITTLNSRAIALSQLIINGTRIVKLEKAVINIGRSHDNDVILDDPSASRHHVQIRLRFGVHTLFDVNSRGGTHINGEPAKQHALRAGDVIQIGGTQIIYMVDAAPQANGGTAPLDPNTLDGA